MPAVPAVRTYLELVSHDAFRAPTPLASAPPVERAPPGDVALFRRLYREVGGPWHWRDRDAWTDATLEAHLRHPGVSVWVMREGDALAGFFELRDAGEEGVEIVYFGLHPAFVGRGLGGHLLARAVEAAWGLGAGRVFLNTCTLDAPAAMPNYLARGFRPFRTEEYVARLPDPDAP